MKNYLKLTSVLFAFIILFSQCKDSCEGIVCMNGAVCEDGVCECPTGYGGEFCEENIYLLKEITVLFNDTTAISFEYDNMNRISQSAYSEEGVIIQESQYTYSEDSTFIRTDYYPEQEFWTDILTYPTSDRLDLVYVGTSGNRRTTYLSGLDSNCGYTAVDFPDTYNGYRDEIIYSGSCDVNLKHFRGDVDTLVYTIQINVDDSEYIHQSEDNSVVESLSGYDYYYATNKKNIRSLTFYDSEGVIKPNNSYSSIFEVDDNNFPIREIRTYLNGNVGELLFEYY